MAMFSETLFLTYWTEIPFPRPQPLFPISASPRAGEKKSRFFGQEGE